MIDQPWNYGIFSKEKSCYQPVPNCTYCPVLGSYNNLDIIHLSQKSTSFEMFEEIHQVVIDLISDNMASLVQPDECGTNNTDDTTTNGYYVIKLISEAYMLQNNTAIDGKIISAGELFFKAQYI